MGSVSTEIVLQAKKLKSLRNKYFAIPPQYLHYYPNIIQEVLDTECTQPTVAVTRAGVVAARARKAPRIAVGARRPTGTIAPKDQKFILSFLRSKLVD
jgi:hypothetical protein